MTTKRLATLLLLLPLFGCSPKEASTRSASPASDEILVGQYGAMTGPQAYAGQSTHNGVMLAIDEVNRAGGIHGRNVRIINEDDQGRPEQAASVAAKLISQNGVVAIIGGMSSSCSIAAAPICEKNRVPMITPPATNPRVTQLGQFIFRMCFIDPDQGPALARYAVRDLRYKRAAILTDITSDYSTGLTDAFAKTYVDSGGVIVARQSFVSGDNEFRPQLTAIREAKPDFVFVPAYYIDVGPIAAQARDLGMKQIFIGGDGWDSPALFDMGRNALEGSLYSTHYHVDDPTPVVRDFVQRYQARFGDKPNGLAALGYDAALLLADAMKRSAKIDGPAVRDAIASTRNFPAVTGMITLGPDRNPVGKKLVILEVRNNHPELKTTIDPAASTK
ncbi:MAG TPA: ABC transporter substrate-binding protein [Thermoanaerobaculia bacterium]|nr:ABC transporter substrate-binding protein [Thermoanaerobaculia bacterium]